MLLNLYLSCTMAAFNNSSHTIHPTARTVLNFNKADRTVMQSQTQPINMLANPA